MERQGIREKLQKKNLGTIIGGVLLVICLNIIPYAFSDKDSDFTKINDPEKESQFQIKSLEVNQEKIVNQSAPTNNTSAQSMQDHCGKDNLSCIRKKKDRCVEMCTGENDAPYLESECRSSCNQMYYYGGEEGLDSAIKEYGG